MTTLQTTYKGYTFQSENEARWAVFFDEMKMQWTYNRNVFVILGKYHGQTQAVTIDRGKEIIKDEFHYYNKYTCHGTPFNFFSQQGKTKICPRCGFMSDYPYGSGYFCEPCDFDTPCGSGNPLEIGLLETIKVEPYKGCLELVNHDWTRFKTAISIAIISSQRYQFNNNNNNN